MDIQALYDLYLQYPSVQTDTRHLQQGDLFFALRGPSFNGNQFARQAIDNGASYAIIDDAAYAEDEQFIVVEDVLAALQALAKHHRQQLHIPFIAITGSNGKTTTKELITAVLQQQFKTYATVGNLNNHIGVPLTILRIGKDAEMAIIEMGANHLHEIESYCQIALPTHGLITNCGKAHIEGFGSLEGIRKGKGELYDYLRANNGTIFRNTDLDYLEGMAAGIDHQITYGTKNAHYIGKPVTDNILLKMALLQEQGQGEVILPTQLVGAYNFPNVMAAVAIGLHFGVAVANVQQAIRAYTPDNSRSQWLVRGSNHVILDAYNANPSSMRAAILNFAALDLPQKLLWLGGMKEMGASEQAEHTALLQLIGEYPWAGVLLVGKEFEGLNTDYPLFESSAEAAAYLGNRIPENANILIKGSRGSKMEVLLNALPL